MIGLFQRKSPTEKELHIIGNAHRTDPREILSILKGIGLDKKSLYFDELKEERWRVPSSLPPFEEYVRTITEYLSSQDSSIVPMGHDDLLYPRLEWPIFHACQPAEDLYMVEHVVVPILGKNKHSNAVIHVGYTHLDRFVEELERQGYKPKTHVLCEPSAPEISYVLALREFAEGRSETYLEKEFMQHFFERIIESIGRQNITAQEASAKLARMDPEFLKSYRDVAQQIVNDQKFYAQHKKKSK